MTHDISRCRTYLENFDFVPLFVEELGWDHHRSDVSVDVGNNGFALSAIAEKRGVQVFECRSGSDTPIPDYNLRKRIEKQLAKHAYEHLIIFTNGSKTTQIWQWVARVPGQPDAYREIAYRPLEQTGDLLLQKLMVIRFTLDEEESIDIAGATHRLKDAFDRDKVTKKFFAQFKKEHAVFLDFIKGLSEKTDREWYASLMLNRLMFVWFIQKKGFLDGDPAYLQNRLGKLKQHKGKGKFHTFYRYFLLALFHQGFARQPSDRQLDPELEKLLGNVPYLNGGLFDPHQLETENQNIHIPDEAFENLFSFFDQYDWHLDTRTVSSGNEINPDVLGYIFEKYINQKQMGAYYTKEDITEYISKSTIIPFLFDSAKKKCAIAFQPGSALWNLLRDNPDRYIYPAMRKGVIDKNGDIIPLPSEIETGVDTAKSDLIERRKNWNQPAESKYALPTEIWREHVARRQRCLEIREKLLAGEIHDINDLVTYNLNIRQFVEDVVSESEGPELVKAFYQTIAGKVPKQSNENYLQPMSILDPTCGSGAFLFAALEILRPIYEACLLRMEAFIDDLERSGKKHSPKKFSDFRQILEDVARHPNRTYFILKSIILHNLYGVDIMPEAVEICKLRLFLKLVAQVDGVKQLEPLPDIDFNIRAGNSLVGYATEGDVRRAFQEDSVGKQSQYSLMTGEKQTKYEELQQRVEMAARAYRLFQQMQSTYGINAKEFSESKRNLQANLRQLGEKLNLKLVSAYGIEPAQNKDYKKWVWSHQPFHWFVEFFQIMNSGGFDIVIGNPPYVEYKSVKHVYNIRDYHTISCGNLYAYMWERAIELGYETAHVGFIIPVASVSTDGYSELREIWNSKGCLAISNFNDRPSKLFEGLEHIRLSIILFRKNPNEEFSVNITTYNKWFSELRGVLFEHLKFTFSPNLIAGELIPKIGASIERNLIEKLRKPKKTLGHFVRNEGPSIYYTRKLSWFVQILDFIPSITCEDGEKRFPSELKKISFSNSHECAAFLALLNSNLFYWFLVISSDCRNLNRREVMCVPFDFASISPDTVRELGELSEMLMKDLRKHSKILRMKYKKWGTMNIQCIYPKFSKPIIDKIDGVLAKHYGFTEEELDFVINYDIKYRMGKSLGEGEASEVSHGS